MELKSRLYPYPILSAFNDDYLDSSFDFEVNWSNNNGKVVFDIELSLNNSQIEQLLEENKAEYLVHIECSYSFYRSIFITSQNKIKIELEEDELVNTTQICVFIIAKENLKKYTNKNFNQDYSDLSFDLVKGSIIAIGGEWDLRLEKETENHMPSIFSICKLDKENLSYNIDEDKIIIGLPVEDYENYNLGGKSNEQTIDIINSILIIPALNYVFDELSEDISSAQERFGERRWYKVVELALKDYGLKIDNELFERFSSYQLTDLILDHPTNRALKGIQGMS